MKRTYMLTLAAALIVSLCGSVQADAGGAAGSGGAGISGSTGTEPGSGIAPGTNPGTPRPGSDIGRTPGAGTGSTPRTGDTEPGSNFPLGAIRPGETSLGVERQPVPPGSTTPADSGLPPPPRTGDMQGTGNGVGSSTPGLGGNTPSRPGGSQGNDAVGGSRTR